MCDDARSVKTVSHPTGTRRNNVITTSNRRRFDVIMTLFLRRVSAGTSIHLPRCSVLFFGFRETAGGSGPADVEQPMVSGKLFSTGKATFSYARHATGDSRHILSFVARQKINMCSVTCDTINSFYIQRWRLSNFCKMSLSLHLPPSLCTSTAQIKKKMVTEVPPSTSIKTDTWDIYVTLLNELSAFGETFKQQIVNSSPKYCNSQRGTSQNSS